jgi:hypothetical protein
MLLCDRLKLQQIFDIHAIINRKFLKNVIVGAGLVPALFRVGK